MANEDKKDFNAMLHDSKDMPKFQTITDQKSIEKYGGSRMYFAPPIDYDKVISCGTLIGYLLCTVFSAMSIFGKVSYHFPTVEMFSYFILMLAVQMLFSYLAIRQIKKQSLVDQIRELS